MANHPAVSAYLKKLGQTGGAVKTPKKAATAAENLKAARAARWPKQLLRPNDPQLQAKSTKKAEFLSPMGKARLPRSVRGGR